ncbi:carboxypeptidase-like regulatory domain-containing protein [Siphonobacter sp. SORGH_AS_0500]|uniref:TonB-dependent receptor n=1 Tax=Siphonobacter sp. SORGH_AS_0500 TaxID=1864824 RepID=UPI00285F4D51|nr:carboxypeptidase-like regulatory domain-containing protein [Siphonobacter sp. SORGH_AS_0500]MDR6194581.1 hypothetical protein [Siphonobacter sp. SORGH_AS_0500]
MTLRFLILGLCLMAFLQETFGQHKELTFSIQGKVTNSSSQPLAGGILIISKADSSIVSYTTTDEKGEYTFELEADTSHYLLTVNNLGYISQSRWIMARSQTQHFQLEQEPTQLRQVTVKGDLLPIRVNEDTTSFSVQKFADGTERVVEDILKKLPGVRVDDKGGISFKGKPIDKILLEGDEFFAKNYRILSKNLSADLLDKVEAIENASNTPLLKGIERSDKTVLNLKLKEDRRKTAFGTADLAAGLTRRYEGRATLFSLVDRLKLGIIGSANNTGKNPVPELNYDLGNENPDVSDGQSQHPSRPFLQAQPIAVPGISEERFNQNRVWLGAVNLNLNITSKLKVKAFTYQLSDRNTQQISNRYEYLLEGKSLVVSDTQRLEIRPSLRVSQVALEYTPNQTTLLKWRGNWQGQRDGSFYQIASHNPDFSEKLQQRMSTRQQGIQQELGYIHRFPRSRALTLDAYYQHQNRPQQLLVESGRFRSLFPTTEGNVTQRVRNEVQTYGIQTRWMGALPSKQKYALLGKGSYLSEGFTSGLNTEAGSVTDSLYRNQLNYQKWQGSLEANTAIPLGRLDFYAGISLNFVQLKEQSLGLRAKFVFLNPMIGFTYRINQENKLRAYYSRNQSQPNAMDLSNGYVLTNYRAFQRGYAGLNRPQSDVFTFSYSNSDWLRQFSMHTSVTYLSEKSPSISQVLVNDQFTFMGQVPSPARNESYELASDLSKYLSALEINSTLQLNAGWNSYQSALNSALISKGTIRSLGGKLTLRTAFDGIVNFEVGYEDHWSDIQESGISLGYNRLRKPIAGIKMTPSKSWYFITTSEWTDLRNNTSQNQFYFLDALVRFTPLRKRVVYELSGKNLLGSPTATYSQLSNFLISQSTYQLVARYILARVEFNF